MCACLWNIFNSVFVTQSNKTVSVAFESNGEQTAEEKDKNEMKIDLQDLQFGMSSEISKYGNDSYLIDGSLEKRIKFAKEVENDSELFAIVTVL